MLLRISKGLVSQVTLAAWLAARQLIQQHVQTGDAAQGGVLQKYGLTAGLQ
jgi:hypothetical protein